MIPIRTVKLREDRRWEFSWDATGASYYRIVLYGQEIERVTGAGYVHQAPGWERFAPFIEVVEEEEQALSEQNLSFLIIQWYDNRDDSAYYEVSEYVDGEWVVKHIVQDDENVWVYTIQTPNLEDETLHQFKVIAYDIEGDASGEVKFDVFTVRLPVLDPTTIDMSYDGTYLNINIV